MDVFYVTHFSKHMTFIIDPIRICLSPQDTPLKVSTGEGARPDPLYEDTTE